jgi:hypothetical protein
MYSDAGADGGAVAFDSSRLLFGKPSGVHF